MKGLKLWVDRGGFDECCRDVVIIWSGLFYLVGYLTITFTSVIWAPIYILYKFLKKILKG